MGLLDNKVGFVTGAGQGIGRAIAMSYAREGAKVVIADFNAEMGNETITLITEAIAFTVSTYGRLDIACNSAAVSRGSGPIQDYEREVFDQTLEMCLTNTWLCMKYEIRAMLDTGGGAIVNISSNASLRGQAHNTAYAAAKAGVNVLTKSSAAENGSTGIRINAVSPGVVRTPGLENYFRVQPEMEKGLMAAAVMNRLGEPNEIAEAVTFLSSDRASFITGQLLSVDGGGAIR
jgi:NAD(P)-dependent dehydrogenase (short-subunit alcohol dehydrogenase family)